MPAWAAYLVLKIAIPLVVSWLESREHSGAAQALLASGASSIAKDIKAIKTYPDYPAGPNI